MTWILPGWEAHFAEGNRYEMQKCELLDYQEVTLISGFHDDEYNTDTYGDTFSWGARNIIPAQFITAFEPSAFESQRVIARLSAIELMATIYAMEALRGVTDAGRASNRSIIEDYIRDTWNVPGAKMRNIVDNVIQRLIGATR